VALLLNISRQGAISVGARTNQWWMYDPDVSHIAGFERGREMRQGAREGLFWMQSRAEECREGQGAEMRWPS